MMYRILLILFLVSFACTGPALSSGQEREFLLVYTGDVRGYVEGCG